MLGDTTCCTVLGSGSGGSPGMLASDGAEAGGPGDDALLRNGVGAYVGLLIVEDVMGATVATGGGANS